MDIEVNTIDESFKFCLEQMSKIIKSKDNKITYLERKVTELQSRLNRRKPYEDESLWTTEEVADYFRCSSTGAALKLARNHGITPIPKSTKSDSLRPAYLFSRESVYELKDRMMGLTR